MEWVLYIFVLISIYLLTESINSKKEKPTISPQDTPPIVVQTKPEVPPIDAELQSDIRKFNEWKNHETTRLIDSETTMNLFTSKPIHEIGYSDLLKTIEWRFKRIRILHRDAFSCVGCGIQSEHLHVHHKCYIKDELPWVIDDDRLISVCYKCHKRIHDTEEIPVFKRDFRDNLQPTAAGTIYCYRCNGAGWFPQYRHVEAGVCFRCRGNCIESTIFSTAVKHFISNKEGDYEDKLLDSIIGYYSELDVDFYRSKIKPLFDPDDSTEDDMPF